MHVVLLIQFVDNPRSRIWEHFESVADCCSYICRIFENSLKKANPSLPEISYDIADLYDYVDKVSSDLNNFILITFHFAA